MILIGFLHVCIVLTCMKCKTLAKVFYCAFKFYVNGALTKKNCVVQWCHCHPIHLIWEQHLYDVIVCHILWHHRRSACYTVASLIIDPILNQWDDNDIIVLHKLIFFVSLWPRSLHITFKNTIKQNEILKLFFLK